MATTKVRRHLCRPRVNVLKHGAGGVGWQGWLLSPNVGEKSITRGVPSSRCRVVQR